MFQQQSALNFGTAVQEKGFGDLIPKDTLVWVRAKLRAIKTSRNTNGRYLDLELVVAENQPYQSRKIWTMIMDPFDHNNSQEAKDMGMQHIRRILEGAFNARPDMPNSYNLPSYEHLGGDHLIPVMVGIRKGKDGYEDQNTVEFLSPHSSIKKVVNAYNLLKSGVNTLESKPAAGAQGAPQGFTMQQQPQAGGFTPPQGNTAPQASPQQPSGPGWLGNTPQEQTAQQQAPQQPVAQEGSQTLPPSNTAPAVAGAQQSQMGTATPAGTAGQTASPSNQGFVAATGQPAQFSGQ